MEELVKKILEIGIEFPNGFTIRLPDCILIKSGWVIALEETQNSFGVDGLRKVIEVATRTSYLVGAWKDGKILYYDAVIVNHSEEEATKLGIANKQIAIINLDEKRVKLL